MLGYSQAKIMKYPWQATCNSGSTKVIRFSGLHQIGAEMVGIRSPVMTRHNSGLISSRADLRAASHGWKLVSPVSVGTECLTESICPRSMLESRYQVSVISKEVVHKLAREVEHFGYWAWWDLVCVHWQIWILGQESGLMKCFDHPNVVMNVSMRRCSEVCNMGEMRRRCSGFQGWAGVAETAWVRRSECYHRNVQRVQIENIHANGTYLPGESAFSNWLQVTNYQFENCSNIAVR